MAWKLIGGFNGIVMVAALASIGILIPRRFGYFFIDPVILFAYTAIAFVFASNFAVRGIFGQSDERLIRKLAAGGALYGWLCWALIFGTALGALAAEKGLFALPPRQILVALAFFAFSAAWLAACLAGVLALTMHAAKTAQDMMRMGLFFVLLVILVPMPFLPAAWRQSLKRLITGENLPVILVLLAMVLIAAGIGALSRVRRILDDKNTSLSIV